MTFSFGKPFSYLSTAGAAGGAGYGATQITHSTQTHQKNDEIETLKSSHKDQVENLKKEYEKKLTDEKNAHTSTKATLNARVTEGNYILGSIKHYNDNRRSVSACYALSHRRNIGYKHERVFSFNGKTQTGIMEEWGCPISWAKS